MVYGGLYQSGDPGGGRSPRGAEGAWKLGGKRKMKKQIKNKTKIKNKKSTLFDFK